MNPLHALHNARIAASLRDTRAAIAAGDIDAALHHLYVSLRRRQARAEDIPDDPARVTPPDRLSDDNYPPETPRWDDDEIDIELDLTRPQDRVNDFLWETGQ